ncbi:sensor histidine kinase [Thermosipho ferrireducens]|uniref:histidine kinase n=2 Tax=Thermosipho ferrireducens TaxID=2571116 RepID=A0ABX7S8M9_9BACT|nr:sensor histidine kinase [Thermosipho ferrireducens]
MLDGVKVTYANKRAREYGIEINMEIFTIFTFNYIGEYTEKILDEQSFELETRVYFFKLSAYRDVVIKYFHKDKLMIIKDITEVNQLKQAKSDFTTAISHELFNPLSVIEGNVYNLLEQNLPENIKESLLNIKRASKRMERIIRQLKMLSMVQLGLYQPKSVDLSSHKVLKEVIAELSDKISQKKMEIIPVIKTEVIKGDTFVIYTILKNLLSNAIKYSYPNSQIYVTLDSDKIEVQDNGIGIKKEELNRIFERFYRSADAVKMATGSGLGLSIVKHLCNLCDYTLKVESDYLVGSRFSVFLNPKDQ